MVIDYQMFVNGKWMNSASGEKIKSINPFNQTVWATVPQATETDINDAVLAAKEAFEKIWRKTSGIERAELLYKLGKLLEENAERMAEIESTDNGKVIRETKNQMIFAARQYRYFAGWADKIYGEVVPIDHHDLFDYTIREPLGVCVLITAWNSPIALLANKLAPAIAAGNTVVIKPSEYASVSTLEFAKLVEQAGFPPGVINIVTGDGRVGHALTTHRFVNKISFTGGTVTGKSILKNASDNIVPVTLELGGKSPNIIFEDANLIEAINGAVAGIFAATGQTCIAGSRLLVQRKVYQEVIDGLIEKAKGIKLGNPLDPKTEMGPVANEVQYNRILNMVQDAKGEGAKLVFGGEPAKEPGLEKGYFISPTIFAEVDNKMNIAQREVFGPVLAVIPFDDEDEAIEIANDTEYGLAAGVWTLNVKRAHRMVRELRAGTVWVNTYRSAATQAPFGGIKASGIGKERGKDAILEFTYVKNAMFNLSERHRDPFSIQT